MANAMQGIMALQGAPGMNNQGPRPMGQSAASMIDQSLVDPKVTQYARSNPEQFNQDILEGMNKTDPGMVYAMRRELAGMRLPKNVVEALLVMVDLLLQDPENYVTNRAAFVNEGVPEELLPPNFDPIFLSGLQMALSELNRNAPQAFAKGGIATLKPIAAEMAKMGRHGDTMLAHINPAEARMLRVMGGSGTINPITGLPEYGWNPFKAVTKAVSNVGKAVGKVVTGTVKAVGNVVEGAAKAVGSVVKGAVNVVKQVAKPIVNVVKKIASSPLGKIALTVAAVYFMGPAGLNVAGTMGLSGSMALGVNTFLGSTAVNLASGQNIGDAIKGGAVSGLTAGLVSGVTGLPAGYEGVPEPAIGDYLSTGDAAALDAAAAREAADYAAGNIPAPAVQTPTVTAPQVSLQTPSVELPSPFQYTAPAAAPFEPVQLAQGPATTMTDGTAGALQPDVSAEVTGAVNPGAASYSLAPPTAIDRATQFVKDVYGGAKDFINEYTPKGIRESGLADQKAAYDQTLLATGGTLDPATGAIVGGNATLAVEAFKAAAPGMIAQYAPLALAGTGALLAAGAFTPKQPASPGLVPSTITTDQTGENIGIGGVNTVYDNNGNPIIIGGGGGTDTSATFDPNALTYGSTNFYRFASGYDPARQQNAPQFRVRRPEEYLPSFLSGQYAKGGIASLSDGTRTYPRKTGAINGPGTATSDSIPALLSDGEFVFTAKAVRGAGGGSRRIGAKRMYAMMKALEKKSNG